MPDTRTSLSIAIVEDDVILREELGHFLAGHGHIVHELTSGSALDDLFQQSSVDIVILDLNLPGQSGFEIAQRYRLAYPGLGIIILSARTASIDRIGSYEQGADIYIPKPCPPDELLAAIGSLARRVKSEQATDTWQLDCVRHMLRNASGTIHMPLLPMETSIISILARAPKHQVRAEDLCVLVAETGPDGESADALTKRALENKISRLRKKFAQSAPEQPNLIRSIRGEGYQLCIPVTVLSTDARNDNPGQ